VAGGLQPSRRLQDIVDVLWLSRSTATQLSFEVVSKSVGYSYRPFVGDFDGDGIDDIFWQRSWGLTWATSTPTAAMTSHGSTRWATCCTCGVACRAAGLRLRRSCAYAAQRRTRGDALGVQVRMEHPAHLDPVVSSALSSYDFHAVASAAKKVRDAALALPADAREELVRALIISLDPVPFSPEWQSELARRLEQIENGAATFYDDQDHLRSMRAKHRG